MSRLTNLPRWMKRTLAALLLAGALAAPLSAAPVHPTASQMAHGALAFAPRTQCPGAPIGC